VGDEFAEGSGSKSEDKLKTTRKKGAVEPSVEGCKAPMRREKDLRLRMGGWKGKNSEGKNKAQRVALH